MHGAVRSKTPLTLLLLPVVSRIVVEEAPCPSCLTQGIVQAPYTQMPRACRAGVAPSVRACPQPRQAPVLLGALNSRSARSIYLDTTLPSFCACLKVCPHGPAKSQACPKIVWLTHSPLCRCAGARGMVKRTPRLFVFCRPLTPSSFCSYSP
jgi:hypothetical protein